MCKSLFRPLQYSPTKCTLLSNKKLSPRIGSSKFPLNKQRNASLTPTKLFRGSEKQNTSVKSLFHTSLSEISPVEANGDIWEEFEIIDSDTEQENNDHYVAEGPISNESNNVEGSIENEMAKMLPNVFDEFSK